MESRADSQRERVLNIPLSDRDSISASQWWEILAVYAVKVATDTDMIAEYGCNA